MWRVLAMLSLLGCGPDVCGKCAPVDAAPRFARSEQFRPVICSDGAIGDPECPVNYILLSNVVPGLRFAFVARPALVGLYFPLFELEGSPTQSFHYAVDVERWIDPMSPPVETFYLGGGSFPLQHDWAPFAVSTYEPANYLSFAFRIYAQ